jgi:dTDP-4-dehydrorhamnose reductase
MKSEIRWLITGSSGILGREMQLVLNKNQVVHFAADKNTLDINNSSQVEKIFYNFKPTHVLNCAAITDVDSCEKHNNKARAINYQGVINLANFCKITKAKFFQVSTNFVFNGENNKIYFPSDPKSPINIYGLTKSDAEDYCLDDKDLDAIIVRTASLYSGYGNNFTRKLLKNLQGKINTNIIHDVYIQPTWAFSVAETIYNLSKIQIKTQIVHATSAGKTTWWEFAKYLCELMKMNTKLINPINLNDLQLPAERPRHAILSANPIDDKLFNYNQCEWKTMLKLSLPVLVESMGRE